MTEQEVMDVTRAALFLIIECSAPLLLISLVVGLIISIFQTVTSIQEQTLTFIPKILCVFITVIICGDWILTSVLQFMQELYSRFADYVR